MVVLAVSSSFGEFLEEGSVVEMASGSTQLGHAISAACTSS